ncbi:hypothetical protein AMQ84_01370 [Paenibacillus riograndensis]|uniref:Translation elongation factor EFTu/EF1A C-terminal domain-containing protein n=1 Tax=Paenibacillus riograndensis TaxID=483937 RepID=A0A132UC60_9BACL|nr:hypothetical protein [Paenibacillus riograndensis]KWX81035.1 hypothetical protein AMQ84_01370 [Paenibacillus riograndensis]
MLLLTASISYENVPFNISVKMRPSIDFGNGFSYSGIITPADKIEMFIMNKWYTVDINMFTVDEEVFGSISEMVKKGCIFKMKAGNNVVGRGRIIDFLFIQ